METRATIYVDDILLYRITKDVNLGVEELQESISSLAAWLMSMGMTISAPKSHLCCFSRDYVDFETISFDIGEHRILCENHVKYFRIIFYSSLSWRQHVEYIVGRALRATSVIKALARVKVGNGNFGMVVTVYVWCNPVLPFSVGSSSICLP